MDDETLECCGSGCTNCVLDRDLYQPKPSKKDYLNVISKDYSSFKLTLIEKCTRNTYQLTFEWNKSSFRDTNETKQSILEIPGGSYLMLRAPKHQKLLKFNPIYEDFYKTLENISKNPDYQGKTLQKHDTTEEDLFISRPYTPIYIDKENCSFKIFIKLEPFGQMSHYIMSLHVNDVTEWKGIYNNVPQSIKNPHYEHVICFSHGVSIAPFYTLIKEITEDDSFEANICLYACFKDKTSILLRDQLNQLNSYWNFKSMIILSREEHMGNCKEQNSKACHCVKTHQKYNETLRFGRIDKEFVQNSIQPLNGKILVLLCGSDSFTSLIRRHLLEDCTKKDIEIHVL